MSSVRTINAPFAKLKRPPDLRPPTQHNPLIGPPDFYTDEEDYTHQPPTTITRHDRFPDSSTLEE